jgi:tripartite-type tricarboxylate transporter receptor subunit TctC
MKMATRRCFKTEIGILRGICFYLLFFMLVLPGFALAQEKYPNRPITYMIGYPAGGGTDIFTRPLISAASKILGQPIVVVNKPGASSAIEITTLKSEKPDGYTIGTLSAGAVTSQHTRKVAYDTAKDFTPIMQYGASVYQMAVRSDSPWKTTKELIDYAKANPGKIRYSTAGTGTPQHLVMERLAMEANIKWTHIPYDGGSPAVMALLGEHVELCAQASELYPHVKSGRLRMLAVFLDKRLDSFPDTPTLIEQGYNIIAPAVNDIIGPKGIPPQIVDKLHDAFKKAMDDPDFIKAMKMTDTMIAYRNSQDVGNHLTQLNEEVGTLVRKLGMRKE